MSQTLTDPVLYNELHKIDSNIYKVGNANTTTIIDDADRRGIANEQRQYRMNQHVLDNNQANTGVLLSAINGNGQNNLQAINRVGTDLGIDIERVGTSNLSAIQGGITEQHRIANEVTNKIGDQTHDMAGHFADVHKSFGEHNHMMNNAVKSAECGIKQDVASGVYGLSRDAFQNQIRTNDHFAALNANVYKTETASQKQASDYFMHAQGKASDYFMQSQQTAFNTQRQAGDYYARSQADSFSVQKQAGDYFAKTQTDMVKLENSLGRLADNHFERTQFSIADTKNALQLQAANNAATIQIEALKNKSDLEKQLAECCCEIKTKISDSTGSIKDLVTLNNTSDIRAQLAAAETKNYILKNAGSGRGAGLGYDIGSGVGPGIGLGIGLDMVGHGHHRRHCRSRSRSRSRINSNRPIQFI